MIAVLQKFIRCKKTLKLIKAFLQAGYSVNGRISKPNKGIFQGGIISPLLLNIYLHELDQYWVEKYFKLSSGQKDYRRKKGLGNVFYLRFGEEFLLLTNGDSAFAKEVKEEVNLLSESLELPINKEKLKLVHINDGYDFLGFNLKRVYSKRSAKHIPLVSPSDQSIKLFKENLANMLTVKNIGLPAALVFQACNRFVTSWDKYYKYTNRTHWVEDLNEFYWKKIRYWLKRKHSNVSSQGSIFKHIHLKYSCKKSSWNLGWKDGKTTVKRIHEKASRYSIQKLETNIYLTDYTIEYCGEDFSSLKNSWQGHSNKTSYIHLWESLMERDKGCAKCGATSKLDIHHIIPQKDGGAHTLDNTLLLCKKCHADEHR